VTIKRIGFARLLFVLLMIHSVTANAFKPAVGVYGKVGFNTYAMANFNNLIHWQEDIAGSSDLNFSGDDLKYGPSFGMGIRADIGRGWFCGAGYTKLYGQTDVTLSGVIQYIEDYDFYDKITYVVDCNIYEIQFGKYILKTYANGIGIGIKGQKYDPEAYIKENYNGIILKHMMTDSFYGGEVFFEYRRSTAGFCDLMAQISYRYAESYRYGKDDLIVHDRSLVYNGLSLEIAVLLKTAIQ
jgi:hypothetical protein